MNFTPNGSLNDPKVARYFFGENIFVIQFFEQGTDIENFFPSGSKIDEIVLTLSAEKKKYKNLKLKQENMNNNLLFDFTVDKENKTVNVKRAFAATESSVWAAWTKPELLDKWWAPRPWVAKTKSMDFKVGGRRLYAMVSPEGHEHWSVQDFTSITRRTNFTFLDGFSDDQGIINKAMPRSDWNVEFKAQKDSTLVIISITYKELSDLETIIKMGFKEGFTMSLNQLDELLTD